MAAMPVTIPSTSNPIHMLDVNVSCPSKLMSFIHRGASNTPSTG
jgi:hypothetical protein